MKKNVVFLCFLTLIFLSIVGTAIFSLQNTSFPNNKKMDLKNKIEDYNKDNSNLNKLKESKNSKESSEEKIINYKPMKEKKPDKPDENHKSQFKKDTVYNYFSFLQGKVLNYSGTLEFMLTTTINNVVEGKEKTTLNLKGSLISVASPPESNFEKNNVPIEYLYEISKDSAIQTIKNSPSQYWQSINPKLTLLKTPIKIGNAWEDSVKINNINYICKSHIVNIYKDKDNKSCVTVERTIDNIPNYPNKIYKEVHIFKEGIGLYKFENTILLNNNNTEQKSKPIALDFHYELVQ